MRSVRRARFMVLLAAVLCLAAPAHVSALRNANVTVEIDLSFLNNAFLRELTVVTDGVVESSVIDAAQTIPIPGSLALAQLRWMTTKPMSQVRATACPVAAWCCVGSPGGCLSFACGHDLCTARARRSSTPLGCPRLLPTTSCS